MKRAGIPVLIALCSVPAVCPAASLSPSQQNEIVKTYCAVCHEDAHRNGGLSLEHYDAARPDPTLSAMILSKVVDGVARHTVASAATDRAAADLVSKKIRSGAIGAAGVPHPSTYTIHTLIDALAAQSAEAEKWTLARDPVLTASIIRELPVSARPGESDMYRLTVSCRPETRQGEVQIAWSPGIPPSGQLISASADGGTPVSYKVAGMEKMGNGTSVETGPGAAVLTELRELPAHRLVVGNLLAGESVTFPFDELPDAHRRALSACFTR